MAVRGEPHPRWDCFSVAVDEELHLFGGHTKSFGVYSFNQLTETWRLLPTEQKSPLPLLSGACTSLEHRIYLYGGWDGYDLQGSLHQLDVKSLKWSKLDSKDGSSKPMKKVGSRMISYKDKLILFGGYVTPSNSNQAGAEFTKHEKSKFGNAGWTNELHMFDIQERKVYM